VPPALFPPPGVRGPRGPPAPPPAGAGTPPRGTPAARLVRVTPKADSRARHVTEVRAALAAFLQELP